MLVSGKFNQEKSENDVIRDCTWSKHDTITSLPDTRLSPYWGLNSSAYTTRCDILVVVFRSVDYNPTNGECYVYDRSSSDGFDITSCADPSFNHYERTDLIGTVW